MGKDEKIPAIFTGRQIQSPWNRIPNIGLPHSNNVTSSKRADTFICHTTTMRKNPINFLYNLGHVALWYVEVGPVANAMEGSTQELDQARVLGY